jgi:DNA repair exonuclease SbcCD ATPase subunit
LIRSVEIKNWRAYEDVTIDLDAVVVFFVAPNGVGKSSFVEATRWALLGAPSDRKAARAVRHGSDRATVTVEFSTWDGAIAQVTRTLTRTGRSTLTVRVGDEELSAEAYAALLAETWGADLRLIDNLMFTDPEMPAVRSAFPVRDHLASVLGVTPLLETAHGLAPLAKDARDRVSDLRSEVDNLEHRVSQLDDEASATAGSLDSAVRERERIADLIEVEETRLLLAHQWERYRVAAAAHNEESTQVLARLAAFIEIDPAEPVRSLDAASAEAAAQLTGARDAKTALQLQAARAERAEDLLAEPTDVCPTCLRPISDHERLAAIDQHGKTRTESGSQQARLDSAVGDANERVERLNGFARQLAALRPPDRPAGDDPGSGVAESLAALREQHLEVVERSGELQARSESDGARRALVDQLADTKRRLDMAATEELLTSTIIDILNELADRTLTERIDPLIAELSARWKSVFGADGLTLAPSGELMVQRPDGTLDISDLSGGERATAMLIARLLITAATTKIPTVWFDEPLEHLDPRRRSAVAKTLVRAGQTRTVAQLIVTTYEDRIARQLAAADPEAVRIVHADKSASS